jgi:phosphopantothenoylcysteine decarboxylase/phosphopantothenate--cysteine ligase
MRILLGVCGSISAYKTLDITRGLIKAGHEVRVILSRGATEFVVPQVFKYLGAQEVYTANDDFNDQKFSQEKSNVLHIDLVKWCDRFAICPLSANTLSRLAHGAADDLMSSVFLAMTEKPIILYPAMNTQMYKHPFTQENIDQVQKIKTLPNVFVHPPASGLLACGDLGEGKLPSVDTIIDNLPVINPSENINKKHILITTGATIAPLDPVRFLTNSSSGITGFHLAAEALSLGHSVTVVAGKTATARLEHFTSLKNYDLHRVVTTADMEKTIDKLITKADVYISSAAVSDISFDINQSKLKKDQLAGSLAFNQATDILAKVLNIKNEKLKVVGFAAETDLTEEVLTKKWNAKPVDLLIGTHVHSGLTGSDEQKGFGTNEAKYSFMEAGRKTFTGRLQKTQLSKEIIHRVTND